MTKSRDIWIRVLETISENPNINCVSLAKKAKLNNGTITKYSSIGEARGLIKINKKGNQKFHTITEKGKKFLEEIKNEE